MPDNAPHTYAAERAMTPLLERLVALSHEATVLVSPEGQLWRMNAAAEDLFGFSAAELSALPWRSWPITLHDATDGAWGALDVEQAVNTILTHGSWERELLVRSSEKPGQRVCLRAEAVRAADGALQGYIVTARSAPLASSLSAKRAVQLQLILNTLPFGVAILDAQDGLVDANDAACRLLNAPPGGLNATYLAEHVTAWYDAEGRATSPSTLIAECEHIFARARLERVVGVRIDDRPLRWLRMSFVPLEDGAQQRSLAVLNDCTTEQEEHSSLSRQVQEQAAALYTADEQRRSDRETLARYAAEVNAQLSSIIEGVLVTGLDHEPLEYNDRFCHFFGLPTRDREPLSMGRHYALVEAAFVDAAGVGAHVRNMFADLESENVTVWDLTDGRRLELHTMPVREHRDARVYGRIWVFRDVTALYREEQRASEQAAFMQRILDWVPANIFVRDQEGRYLLANRATAQAYNTTVEHILGRTDQELRAEAGKPPRVSDQLVETDRQIIAGETDFVHYDFPSSETVAGSRDYMASKTAFTWHDGRRVVLGVSQDVTAQRRAEQELLARQKMLQQMIDLLPANVFIKDAQGRYRVVNKATAAAYALTVEEMLGKTDYALASDWDIGLERLEKVSRTDRQVLGGAPSATYEMAASDGEGKVRHYFVTKTPFPFEGQRGILGVALDLTAQYEAAQRVAAQRAWFQLIIDEAPVNVYVRDAQGRYAVANRSMAQAYYLQPHELLGHTDRELAEGRGVRPEWVERIERTDRAILDGSESTVRYEFVVPDSEGAIERFLISKRGFALEDGSPGVLGTSANITREAEAYLAQRTIDLIYEAAPIGIAVIDRNGVCTRANEALARILGVEHKQELVGIDSFEHPLSSGTSLEADLRRALAGRTATGELEAHLYRGPVTLRYYLTPRIDLSGTVVGVQAIFEDISAYRRLQLRLAETAKLEALGQLAGGAAHSFRNMLTVVNTLTEVSLHNRSLSARLREDLEQVLAAGQSAADLARRLLAFSRRSELELSVFDLNALLRNLARMLPSLLGRQVRLALNLTEEELLVYADRTQLEQMVVNLAANARQAMPDGGTLTISTRTRRFLKPGGTDYLDPQPGRYVQLEVADTGIGLSPEARRHLFEPFFTTKPAGEGTGLGLSMAYGLMQNLGGGISVRSKPQHGTRFRFFLPQISARQAEEAQSVSPRRLPRARRNELVLVVDGDQDSRDELVRLLGRQLGYTVFDAASGIEALEVCEEIGEPFDLLLTEALLPHMTGPELLARIGALCPVRHVLYASRLDSAALVKRAGVPADAQVLPKPYDAEKTARAVRAALDLPPLTNTAAQSADGQDTTT